ncbi:hypothetical protein JCGZ_08588 [Jatropha curcas]|uniref:Uncharacterized protein n=1 Tax=Jatropha curcas TaxID=180498 RepID=A0A067KN64_JATCU|nr:hypothetical protein JCGZ_08588 [Jatropha curcas]
MEMRDGLIDEPYLLCCLVNSNKSSDEKSITKQNTQARARPARAPLHARAKTKENQVESQGLAWLAPVTWHARAQKNLRACLPSTPMIRSILEGQSLARLSSARAHARATKTPLSVLHSTARAQPFIVPDFSTP